MLTLRTLFEERDCSMNQCQEFAYHKVLAGRRYGMGEKELSVSPDFKLVLMFNARLRSDLTTEGSISIDGSCW
jgi:hypothetical protein